MIRLKRVIFVAALSIALLFPAPVLGQAPDRIALFETFGDYKKGEDLFIFGSLARVVPDVFLIIKVINPNGDLCQIQQLTPLSNGIFLTEPIRLGGKFCGLTGEYEAKIYYGDYSKSSTFSVLSEKFEEKSGGEYFDAAVNLVSEKIQSEGKITGQTSLLAEFSDRLETIKSEPSEKTIEQLKDLYVDLWTNYFREDDIFDINPRYRTAIQASLDSTADLIEAGKLDFDVSKRIDQETFAAIFYAGIEDSKNAIRSLNDVFVLLTNVDPVKVQRKQSLSYVELENLLLNLMKKTNSVMNKQLREELAFIFARGTGPLYATELGDLVDLLTKTRFLDAVLRKDVPLYNIIRINWDNAKSSFEKKDTIEEFLESKERVEKLHEAALLLRNLDKVDRFVSSDREENSQLANLIKPEWDTFLSRLQFATSVDDVLNSRQEIMDMKSVIEISSRISKTMDVTQQTNLDSGTIETLEGLLVRVEEADSVSKILGIVSEFDQSINELREKRYPLSILKFDYSAMKAKAELQADYKNLVIINNALKFIDTAQKMADGNPSVSKIDRIEVLLAWASSKRSEIKAELNSYSKDAHKVRASDILQRAKSLENLAYLGEQNNRFLPGYTDFTDSMREELNEARDLVMQSDLDTADTIVRQLFEDWQEVSKAYAEDPFGSDIGYSVNELRKIDYRERIADLSNTVSNFYNADFAPYSSEFVQMTEKASELVDYGNYIDADSELSEIRDFLKDKLALKNKKIIFDIWYNPKKDIWIMEGFVDKPYHEIREKLELTVYDMEENVHSTLKFFDTRYGKFYTQWHAPTEPGLYVVKLQYQNARASQIVNVEEKSDFRYRPGGHENIELAREFKELETFIKEFGRNNLEKHKAKFDPIIADIKAGLYDEDVVTVDAKLSDLEKMIERYLPTRSPSAVIEVHYEDNKIHISGAVYKTLYFSEDLFVDIFDQKGNRVDEIVLKDTSSGDFYEEISKPYAPGTYVAQLQYHDLTVSDFFRVH